MMALKLSFVFFIFFALNSPWAEAQNNSTANDNAARQFQTGPCYHAPNESNPCVPSLNWLKNLTTKFSKSGSSAASAALPINYTYCQRCGMGLSTPDNCSEADKCFYMQDWILEYKKEQSTLDGFCNKGEVQKAFCGNFANLNCSYKPVEINLNSVAPRGTDEDLQQNKIVTLPNGFYRDDNKVQNQMNVYTYEKHDKNPGFTWCRRDVQTKSSDKRMSPEMIAAAPKTCELEKVNPTTGHGQYDAVNFAKKSKVMGYFEFKPDGQALFIRNHDISTDAKGTYSGKNTLTISNSDKNREQKVEMKTSENPKSQSFKQNNKDCPVGSDLVHVDGLDQMKEALSVKNSGSVRPSSISNTAAGTD